MVLTKTAGKSPEEQTSEILKSLEIAQALAGELESLILSKPAPEKISEKSHVSIETPKSQALLISTAPPVAGADLSDQPDDDMDYYESRPGKGDGANRLQVKLQAILPTSITVQLPGFDEALTLVRGISSPGLKFVHVTYSAQGSIEQGPRVVIMTSQKDIDVNNILKDITTQAGAMYSKEKRTLQPRAIPKIDPPSNQDLQEMLNRDRRGQGNNLPVSSEDVEISKEWAQSRSPRWQ